jgi:GST-like protein
LETQLAKHAFLAGPAYSLADMASLPWVLPHKRFGVADLAPEYPHVARWHQVLRERAPVRRGVALLADAFQQGRALSSDETKNTLFRKSKM